MCMAFDVWNNQRSPFSLTKPNLYSNNYTSMSTSFIPYKPIKGKIYIYIYLQVNFAGNSGIFFAIWNRRQNWWKYRRILKPGDAIAMQQNFGSKENKLKVSRFIIVIPILHGAQTDVPPWRLWNSKNELGLSSKRRNRTITINYSKIAEHSVHTYSGNEDNSLDTHYPIDLSTIKMPSDYTYPPGGQFGKITCKTLEKALHLLSPSNKSHMASDLPCNQVKEPHMKKKSTKHRINQKCSKHNTAFILNESGPHSVVYYVPVDLLHKC